MEYFPRPEFLLPWFYANKRDLPWRKTKDAYAVWVSEIMLQQTRVEAAKEHYVRFMKTLPSVFDLAACDDEKLMKLWEGLGYYSRARNMKKCAEKVAVEYGGVFPRDKASLLKLPGIGEYTAGSVSSIAYDEKNPAIDGNVLRVCARVQGDFTPIDDGKRKRELDALLRAVYPDAAGDYTQSLMELGALVCLPENPKCAVCPMRGNCVAERDELQEILPVMPKKNDKKRILLSVFFLRNGDSVLLRKRPTGGVLAGMWEFPNAEADVPPEETLKSWGIEFSDLKKIGSHTHVFTHLVWEMTAYGAEIEGIPEGFVPATKEKIRREISLPSAFRWGIGLL